VICPEEREAKRIRNQLSRWHTLPPEAVFHELNSYIKLCLHTPAKATTTAAVIDPQRVRHTMLPDMGRALPPKKTDHRILPWSVSL